MKDERGGKIITKFATAAPKTHDYRVQKDDHEIEDSEFTKGKWVAKSVSKELTSHDFDKYVYDVTNKPIAKKQMSYRKKLYGSFLWMGFNCLKAIESLRRDSSQKL